jgi:hypothetical protein
MSGDCFYLTGEEIHFNAERHIKMEPKLDAHGNPDLVASRQVAAQMVTAYGIVFGPAFPTRHSARRAIDMTIT